LDLRRGRNGLYLQQTEEGGSILQQNVRYLSPGGGRARLKSDKYNKSIDLMLVVYLLRAGREQMTLVWNEF